jgi:hypothetical protein
VPVLVREEEKEEGEGAEVEVEVEGDTGVLGMLAMMSVSTDNWVRKYPVLKLQFQSVFHCRSILSKVTR